MEDSFDVEKEIVRLQEEIADVMRKAYKEGRHVGRLEGIRLAERSTEYVDKDKLQRIARRMERTHR